MKITRRRLRKIISEEIDSMIKYRPGSDPKRKLRHGHQQPPIPPELFADDEYKEKLSSMRKDSEEHSIQADELSSMLGHDQFFGGPEQGYTKQKAMYDRYQKYKEWDAVDADGFYQLLGIMDFPVENNPKTYRHSRITNLTDEELEKTHLYKIVSSFDTLKKGGFQKDFANALSALKRYMGDTKYSQDRKAVGSKILKHVKRAIKDMEAEIDFDYSYARRDFDDED